MKSFSLFPESLSEISSLQFSLSHNQNENGNDAESEYSNSKMTIQICGTDFFVSKSILTFVSPFAFAEASNNSNIFAIDCPSNTFGVSPSKLIQHFQNILSLFEGRSSFSFDESDYFSLKYLFKALKSESLIHSFNVSITNDSQNKSFKFIPFSNFDFSDEFTFIISKHQFKCGFLSASLISPFAKRMIEHENCFEMEIKIPPQIENEHFLKTFFEIFDTLNGFSFSITKLNASSVHSIGRQLLNQKLLDSSFCLLSESIESKSPIDQLLFYLDSGSSIESDLISSVASEFYLFSKEQLSRIPINILSQILSSKSLKIEDETIFFDILISLYSNDTKYFSHFEFIQFSKLSAEQIIHFFDIFNPSLVSSNLWNSISSIFKKTKIDSNRNPHDCQIVKVTASSIRFDKPSFSPQNILEWGTSPDAWYSENQGLAWLDIDLLGKKFILKGVCFLICFNRTPKKWVLQGSNGDDDDFENIYQSNNDSRFNSKQNTTISLSIDNCKQFSRYRITAQDRSWADSDQFILYSIEFYGELLSPS
jgi:hypothetical protein